MTNEQMASEQMTGGKGEGVYLAALAGLLHDVGKFAQRAGIQPDAESQAFGPEDYGNHGAHAKWSVSFIHAHVPEQWRRGLSPVLFHHRPQDRLSKIVALADRLSAAEREGSGEGHARQLLSIFCQVGEEVDRPPGRVWPLLPLRLSDEVIFPISPLASDAEARAYGELWGGFESAASELPGDDLPTYVEGLLYALQRYAWCVPGAYYRSVPDVSLFDHSRTAAALAACLIDLEEPALDDLLGGRRQGEPLALLVGGDISGVQDFIYTITARGAAKGLRGRSFYLQLLTEAAARFILRELALPVTNLLYVGGGHFYLLAPASAAKRLDQIRAGVSRKLLEHHGGDLYLALGWTAATAADFDRKQFGDKWQEASREMGRAKRQRFAELNDAALLTDGVFGPLGRGGDEKGECQVCHYDGPVYVEDRGTEEERRVCALCQSLEQLGTDLRDADYLLLAEVEPSQTARAGYEATLRAFGMAAGFTAVDGRVILRLPAGVRRAALLAMRDLPDVAQTAGSISRKRGYPVAPGTRYTANVTPRRPDGSIATFDWLQDQAKGVKRLGVLRMDVDDLGDLFQWGLKDAATLSRVAALSFALSLFFEGWVGELCRQANLKVGADRVYAIYSGGDDLFVVGAWDVLPALAAAIHDDLARFAAANPAVHISGGLTLHGGKYPLYQAARDAEEALGRAKDLERLEEPDHHKDAFHFLGVTFPWERFDDLVREKDRLVHLVAPPPEGLGAKRELLRTLLRLYVRYAEAVHTRGKPTWGPWMWLGAYALKRMETRYRNNQEAQEEIKRFREALKEDGFRYIETLGPAARWAELLMRKE